MHGVANIFHVFLCLLGVVCCEECRGDRGELTHFSLKTIFCQNGTCLLNCVGICLCSMLYRMLVNNLKTPKTITVFT